MVAATVVLVEIPVDATQMVFAVKEGEIAAAAADAERRLHETLFDSHGDALQWDVWTDH